MSIGTMEPLLDKFHANLDLVVELGQFATGHSAVRPDLPEADLGAVPQLDDDMFRSAVERWWRSFSDSVRLLREFRELEDRRAPASPDEVREVTEATQLILAALVRRLQATAAISGP